MQVALVIHHCGNSTRNDTGSTRVHRFYLINHSFDSNDCIPLTWLVWILSYWSTMFSSFLVNSCGFFFWLVNIGIKWINYRNWNFTQFPSSCLKVLTSCISRGYTIFRLRYTVRKSMTFMLWSRSFKIEIYFCKQYLNIDNIYNQKKQAYHSNDSWS